MILEIFFTRTSLPNSEIIRKQILYHAIKSNMLDSNIKLFSTNLL